MGYTSINLIKITRLFSPRRIVKVEWFCDELSKWYSKDFYFDDIPSKDLDKLVFDFAMSKFYELSM